MSYAQFGYTAFPPTSQLMVGTNNSSGAPGSPCCETGGRSSATTIPAEAQTAVCSLPATYDSRLLSTYPRLTSAGLYSGPTYADQPYPNFDSSAFYPSLGSAYAMKDPTDPWRGIGPSASYYYDSSLAAYGYGGLDFNGARRKNVTRDSTSTLKAWLNEHRKNPYPTKGEKIMLAIITKMTLTQVSTWFANARRRLKKENKMTWEPRNKIDADDIKDYEDDDLDDDDNNNDPKEIKNNNNNSDRCSGDDRDSKGIAGGDPPTRIGVRRESIRGESERGEGCADVDRRLTPGRPSNGKSDDYPMLRHPTNSISEELSRIPLASCATSERHLNPHIPTESPLLAPDFTPSDSSSPSLPDMQTFIRSPGETPMGTRVTGRSPVSAISPSPADSGSHNNNNSSTNASTNIDLGDPESHHHTKPKIWSLADTATSKSPAPSSASLTEVNSPGSMTDMLGHCGWFSVNPYQVNASPSSLGGLVGNHGYPPSFAAPSTNGGMFGSAGPGPASVAAAAAAAAAYGHGFSPLPPQTDTPPQTPPNLKMSAALPLSVNSANYLSGQAAHLYLGQAAASGMCSGSTLSNMQVGKNGGIYSLGHLSSSGRSYRSDTPADYSSSAGLRSTSIQ